MGREKSAKSEVAGNTMSRAAAGSITQSIIVQSNDTVLTLCDSHRHSIPRLAIPGEFVVPACIHQVVIRCSLS
jgi:protein-tyrosine-phosphatase